MLCYFGVKQTFLTHWKFTGVLNTEILILTHVVFNFGGQFLNICVPDVISSIYTDVSYLSNSMYK